MFSKPTKINHRFLPDGTKVRIAKKSGAIIPYPPELKLRRRTITATLGPKDTDPDTAKEVSFKDYFKLLPLIYMKKSK